MITPLQNSRRKKNTHFLNHFSYLAKKVLALSRFLTEVLEPAERLVHPDQDSGVRFTANLDKDDNCT